MPIAAALTDSGRPSWSPSHPNPGQMPTPVKLPLSASEEDVILQ